MHNYTHSGINSLASWKNPVYAIKDPLKQRWAEIVQTMSTHIDGVCPLHIYINRRPLESQNPYAIEYRVNNFQPLTKDPFDRCINGIIENCNTADVTFKFPDSMQSDTYFVGDKEVYEFCQNDLVRIREKDPNAVIVPIPLIDKINESTVSINGVDIRLVGSDEIKEINNNLIEFVYEKKEKKEILLRIEDGQYTLKVPKKTDGYDEYPIVSLSARQPYIYISENIVFEGKYKLRIPYLFGAAAWGDKFYGQESDFTIQATRYTYLKEIRAKEKCDEVGAIMIEGRHCNADKTPCKKCGGSGYVKDDSPLGTIYVDYSKLNTEDRAFPQVIQWAEPPQAALTSSKEIVTDYFEKVCESLGLVKQNFTNQSGVSKGFDYKEKISTIYKIFTDNLRVAKEVYQFIEYILFDEQTQTTDLYLVGEIGKATVSDLLIKLTEAKTNQSPSFVITSLIDQIYTKTLPPDISEFVIKVAKMYDKLYIYGSDEITKAKAHFGNSLTEKDLIVHNTLIDVIVTELKNNPNYTEENMVKFLDNYYSKYTQTVPTATTIGLL